MKKKLLIIGGIFLALNIATAIYYGIFTSLELLEKNVGGETFVYREVDGDYGKSGVIIESVSTELKNNYNIDCEANFGIFYDDPKIVSKEKLRSDLGCILSKESAEDFEKSKNFSDLIVKRNPIVKSVVVKFPYRNQLSIKLGALRFYPKLSYYFETKNYQSSPKIEIYNLKNNYIEYRMVIVEK